MTKSREFELDMRDGVCFLAGYGDDGRDSLGRVSRPPGFIYSYPPLVQDHLQTSPPLRSFCTPPWLLLVSEALGFSRDGLGVISSSASRSLSLHLFPPYPYQLHYVHCTLILFVPLRHSSPIPLPVSSLHSETLPTHCSLRS